jgi:hypothetical protein
MATEIIIPPDSVSAVQQAVPSGMAINPILDWCPLLGIPLWFIVTVFLVLLVVGVLIYWVLRMSRLNPVKGWGETLKKMTQEDAQVWVISRIQKLTIECMTIKDNVLSSHDPLTIGMWYVASPMGIISIGGARGIVISEDFDRNRDIIAEISLCHALDEFNANLESLKKKMGDEVEEDTGSGNPGAINKRVMKPVEKFGQYVDYGRDVLYQMYPYGLETPSYSMFAPNRFRKYFPTGNTSTHFGAENIMEARDMNIDRKEKGFWDVHALLAASVVIGLIGFVAVAFFPMGA